MTKLLFGIFAHPDDEAFGPVATLLHEVERGTELHLITLTAGENGTNPDNLPHLGEVRLEEWRAAGQLIGATSMHHLGYIDGTLDNLSHIDITQKITDLVHEITRDRTDIELEFMSLDLNGYTGHIDHIVASRSACLAFYRLKEEGLSMTRIRLACLSREEIPSLDTSFVLMEPGRTPEEINETIDGSAYIERIHEIMRAHHTQRNDYATVTSYKGDALGMNYFIIKN